MKKWEFTYRTKDGREKIINNENCWKHLEEDIWRGITWCGDHLGVCLATGGLALIAIAASKQKKRERIASKSEGEIIFVNVEDVDKFEETLAENPQIKVEEI